MDIYQSIHRGWMNTTGNVLWLQTFGRNMCIRQRE